MRKSLVIVIVLLMLFIAPNKVNAEENCYYVISDSNNFKVPTWSHGGYSGKIPIEGLTTKLPWVTDSYNSIQARYPNISGITGSYLPKYFTFYSSAENKIIYKYREKDDSFTSRSVIFSKGNNGSNGCPDSISVSILGSPSYTEKNISTIVELINKDKYTNNATVTSNNVNLNIKGSLGSNSSSNGYTSDDSKVIDGDEEIEGECETILPESLKELLQQVLNYIRIIAPILTIVLSAADFMPVIASGDSEIMKKTVKKLSTRLIVVVLLFIIPTILSWFLGIFNNIFGTCGIS